MIDMSRLKKASILLTVSFVGVLCVFYAFEIFLFVTDPVRKLPFDGNKDGIRYTWGHPVVNNQYGFREEEFLSPKPAGTYRVMVLGDSLTWGAGLAPEQRYTDIVERMLNERVPTKKFELLNFAVSGGPTTRERDILYEFKGVVQPDLIVIGYCANDPLQKSAQYSPERAYFETTLRSAFTPLERAQRIGLGRLGKRVKDGIFVVGEQLGLFPDWITLRDAAYKENSREWQEMRQALVDIKAVSDELQLPAPLFAVLNESQSFVPPGEENDPAVINVAQHYRAWHQQALRTAREIGYVAYDHRDIIKARNFARSQLRLHVLDNHPSAEINLIYAAELFKRIVNVLDTRANAAANISHLSS